MGLGNFFRRKFAMDDDGKVSDKELSSALGKSHEVFAKHLRFDLDRDPNFHTHYHIDPKNPRYMTVELGYGDSKHKEGLLGRITIDKRSGDYKVESFFDEKSHDYTSQGHELARTRDFGEDHAPKPKPEKTDYADHHLGQREGDGHYHLIREVHERGARVTVGGRPYETGRVEYGDLVMVDPQGKEILRETYVSGPNGNGMIADKNRYPMDSTVKPFTVEGGGQLMGHRISGSHYLVHQELGAPGTKGCFGLVRPGAMDRYEHVWSQIPRNQRPTGMDTERPLEPQQAIAQDRTTIHARQDDKGRGLEFADLPKLAYSEGSNLAENASPSSSPAHHRRASPHQV